MGRAYSADLRGRVIGAAETGMSARAAADRFGIGVATAIRWVRRWRETRERVARRQGHPGRSKLDDHEEFLIGRSVDITLEEMRARLAEERGVGVGIGTLWRFFDRRGITLKKRRGTRASRSATTSTRPASPGSRRSRTSTRSGSCSSTRPD